MSGDDAKSCQRQSPEELKDTKDLKKLNCCNFDLYLYTRCSSRVYTGTHTPCVTTNINAPAPTSTSIVTPRFQHMHHMQHPREMLSLACFLQTTFQTTSKPISKQPPHCPTNIYIHQHTPTHHCTTTTTQTTHTTAPKRHTATL